MSTPAGLWLAREPLILASGSATRLALLRGVGLEPLVVPAAVDERALEAMARAAGQDLAGVATVLACEKALAVSRQHPAAVVVGADQTLDLDGQSLTKPADVAAVRRQIALLSGRTHALHAGVAIARGGTLVWRGVETATLAMRPLSPAFLDWYAEAAGPHVLGSVGAYQWEGLGAHLFQTVVGDHSTILGLPLPVLLAALREHGYLLA
jgi:septum formation protein